MNFILRPLNDLCERNIVFINPKAQPDKKIWYIDISAVDNTTKKITSPQRMNGGSASVRARQLVHKNDVIVSTTRPNLNAVAIVPSELHGEICSTGFCVLRCGSELDPDYLFSFVQSMMFVDSLVDLVKGALYPAVTDKQVFVQSIPWVPLDQQRQIAEKFKAQFVEVETARKALELQQKEIVNLANSIIRASIEQSVGAGHARDLSHGDDPARARPAPTECQQQEIVNLANTIIRASLEQSVGAGHARDLSQGDDPSRARPAPTSVTETRLGEVLEEIKKGIGETWADYPVLGATRGGLAPAKEQPGKYPQRYKPVSCGTVFYNPMRILIGSIAFVDDDDEPGITSPDYVALRGKPGLVDSRWFYYWLRSPYGEHCINSLARGAVRERMLFNRLAEGSILLPSYPEQLRASKALATLKSMKSAIQKQLNDLDKIPERLLAQAFEKI